MGAQPIDPWTPPPPPPPPPGEGRSGGGDRSWVWQAAVLGLVFALLLTLGGGALLVLNQQRQIRSLERDLAETRSELTAAREELATLRAQEETEEGGGSPLGGLLDGLLDGLGEGGLGGLGGEGGLDLGGLLDGLGGGTGQAGLIACLQGALRTEGGTRPIPDGAPEAQVQAIAERVEEIRGQSFDGEVDAAFLDPAAFEAEVRRVFDEEYDPEAADLDQRVLVALGAIPATLDLREAFLELISGQAAGFYRPETGEIVVRAEPGSLSPVAQVTLAHELEHALTDERVGLPDREDDADADGNRAALSLVEGAASLAMQQFAASSLGMLGQLQLGFDPAVAESQAQLRGFPYYLQRDLTFPYEDGLVFTCGIHADGGWPAVDAAYDDVPTTTAQILWPERWREGEDALAPTAAARAPSGWSEQRSTTFGAADLLWLLEAPGDDPTAALDDARRRAAAWAGGHLRLLTRGADSAVTVDLVQREGEADLCETVTEWYAAAFPGASDRGPAEGERLARDGGGQAAVVRCPGSEVQLRIAPDLATARGL